MANRKQRRRLKEKKFIEDDENYKNIIIILIVVIVIFGLFYLITVAVNNKNRKLNTKEKEQEVAEIQYDTIIAEKTFSMNRDSYYVFFYDKEGSNLPYYSYLVSNSTKSEKVYVVDLSDGINNKYISDESNPNVTNLSNLRVKEPTLIKITNKTVELYLEDIDAIKTELGL